MNLEFGKCLLKRTSAEERTPEKFQQSKEEDNFKFGHLYDGEHTEKAKHLPFMLIHHIVPMDTVISKMLHEWKIHLPKIVLLIICGSKNHCSDYHKVKKLKSLLIEGLVNALHTTETWVCLDSLDREFGRKLGKEHEKETYHRKVLMKSTQKRDSFYPSSALIGVCATNRVNIAQKFEFEESEEDGKENGNLNKHLNYYIFVQAKKEQSKRNEELFILNFIKYLGQDKGTRNTGAQDDRSIPIMAIICQGDLEQIDLVLKCMKNNFPVLVIQGSCGLANLLFFTYSQVIRRPESTNEAEYIETVVKSQVVREINCHFPNLSNSGISDRKLCSKLIDCIRYSKQGDREFMTVLKPSDLETSSESLTTFLLKAALKSQIEVQSKDFHHVKDNLLLAVDWNCPEAAKTEVFSKDVTSKLHADHEMFAKVLIAPRREEFVDMFLSQGFKVHKFLDGDTLTNLFAVSLNREYFRTVIWETVFGLGKKAVMTRHFIDNKLTKLLQKLTSIPDIISTKVLDQNARGMYSKYSSTHAEQKALVALAIWSILSYRISLAKVIWKYSAQPIHLALVYSIILNKTQYSIPEFILNDEIKKDVTEFNLMAAKLMALCYEKSTQRGLNLLRDKEDLWSFKPLLEMAAFAKNRQFIATECCQLYLDNQLNGSLIIKDLPYGDFTVPKGLKIILAALFIFPMWFWVEPLEVETASTEPNELKQIQNNVEKVDSKTFIKKDLGSALLKSIYNLYSSPICKFWLCQVFYAIYLFLFSIAVLWPSCGNPRLDFWMSVWTGVIIIDALYQIIILPESASLKLRYIEVIWMIIFFLCYTSNRVLMYKKFITPYVMKVILCLALLFFFYRVIFRAFTLSPKLGPMLYQIKRMALVDFLGFIRVTALIMFSNGVVIYAIIYPDYPLTYELFKRIFYRTALSLFKMTVPELGTVHPKCIRLKRSPNGLSFYGLPDYECRVGKYFLPECPNPGIWPYVFSFQYFLLLRIVLLTLLMALFSNTQTRLAEVGTEIWKYHRYQTIYDFSNRVAFPAPFSPIMYCIKFFKCIYCFLCRTKSRKDRAGAVKEEELQYWKDLTSNYYTRNLKETVRAENSSKSRIEKWIFLKDEIGKQKLMIRNWQGHLTDIQIRSKHTFKVLRNSQLQVSLRKRLGMENVSQLFSRISPYPNTQVFRFPVSDKRVQWGNSWQHYEPIAYTMPKEDFPPDIRPYVDIDIQRIREAEGDDFKMPMFQWNTSSVSPVGISYNRLSWIRNKFGNPFMYSLDTDDLPMNPQGRTGLRGRGYLPRWGPNHHIYVIVTRWEEVESAFYHQYLEVVLSTKDDLILPGGFVTSDNTYSTIRTIFQATDEWFSEEDMLDFFKSLSSDIRVTNAKNRHSSNHLKTQSAGVEEKDVIISERVLKGYLDEAVNTDQAWCEAEVWHVHYDSLCKIDHYFDGDLKWVVLNEEILNRVPPGQAYLLNYVTKKMKASLDVL